MSAIITERDAERLGSAHPFAAPSLLPELDRVLHPGRVDLHRADLSTAQPVLDGIRHQLGEDQRERRRVLGRHHAERARALGPHVGPGRGDVGGQAQAAAHE